MNLDPKLQARTQASLTKITHHLKLVKQVDELYQAALDQPKLTDEQRGVYLDHYEKAYKILGDMAVAISEDVSDNEWQAMDVAFTLQIRGLMIQQHLH